VAADSAWTEKHVRRLFWRAGFGPAGDEPGIWAERGKSATIDWFLNGGGGPELVGPEPSVDGQPLDPVNEWGHDRLWWLDRMVRSQRPLAEKMTLFWHDHFATSGEQTPLMLRQNRTFRKHALGNFRRLLRDVTTDDAMQLFLSVADSHKDSPNENYAREVMELFALGRGYGERDIREAARALTGFRSSWSRDGFNGIRFDREAHDRGRKRMFGKRGRFDWRDVVNLVCNHPAHAPFLVTKLWAFFITEPLDSATKKRLVRVYKRSKLQMKPLLREILSHPALFERLDRPDMVKSPVMFVAGMLRQVGIGVNDDHWVWLMDGMGQSLFDPPSVAGWDGGPAWMSTNSVRARFSAVAYVVRENAPLWVPRNSAPVGSSSQEALERAKAATGQPWTSSETDAALLALGDRLFSDVRPPPRDESKRRERTDMRERIYRHFLLSGPDAHLH
jgi:uncharacterized protein (DUF1800 family)